MLLLPEGGRISIVFLAGGAFVGYLPVSKTRRAEEARRTHPSGRENRLR